MKRIYGFKPWEVVPSSWEALEIAWKRANCMEETTRLFPMASFWEELYCKLKITGKEKHQQARVHFGEIKLYCSPKPDETGVVFTETTPISDKIDREVASRQILEKCVLPLLSQGGSLQFSSSWRHVYGGTHKDLQIRLVSNKITLEQLIIDLRYIMTYFEKNYIAILGYRTAWKLLPTYEERVCRQHVCRHLNASSTQMAWIKTGKNFYFLPKIRLYLIKVCKDPITAARRIQQTWRKWKVGEEST